MQNNHALNARHKRLLIIGGGGHGRVVADCAEQCAFYQHIIFLVDCTDERKKIHHWPVINELENFHRFVDDHDFIVALGDNKTRAEILEKLALANANIISLIHPSATISPYTTIERGVVVFANAVVNIGSKLLTGVIINTAATIDHDCLIHSCVHISPGANIAGGVEIGPYSWLGIGAATVQAIQLAENTQVAAGAVVTASTQANSLYMGVPAKLSKS
tara:strand:+ start:2240 stop:2893 length:654 start_codon:yes stop_codon:yes gene_type:complete